MWSGATITIHTQQWVGRRGATERYIETVRHHLAVLELHSTSDTGKCDVVED
jgi:hypothetical protein